MGYESNIDKAMREALKDLPSGKELAEKIKKKLEDPKYGSDKIQPYLRDKWELESMAETRGITVDGLKSRFPSIPDGSNIPQGAKIYRLKKECN